MLKRSRRLLLNAGMLFSSLALALWLLWPDSNERTEPGETASRTSGGAPAANGTAPYGQNEPGSHSSGSSALDLALKGISLSQGEGGFELWSLKAEWANLYKAEGFIVVVQPRLTYFLRDEQGAELKVRSEKGDIKQDEQILRFMDKVKVTTEDKLLTGDLLVYNGTAKTMTLPQGGFFSTKSASGRADVISWHIDEKRIVASGHVLVDMASPQPGHENRDGAPSARAP